AVASQFDPSTRSPRTRIFNTLFDVITSPSRLRCRARRCRLTWSPATHMPTAEAWADVALPRRRRGLAHPVGDTPPHPARRWGISPSGDRPPPLASPAVAGSDER